MQEITIQDVLAKNITIIDIRNEEDYILLHLPKSKNIPFGKWDKTKAIYLICQYGIVSKQAAKILLQKGFKQVFHIIGGVHAYKNYL
ncbi:MAG: rhodanese-like domain-containing protein [Chitinophagaceae bacterium]